MAAYTSVATGNWNAPATWGEAVNYPSLDGDTATIATGHVVTFNADLSALATGLGAIVVTGTLKFASASKLKIAASISGAGVFRCGESGATVTGVQILVNGNFNVQVVDAQYWGADRTGVIFGELAAAANIGASSITVDRVMDIRVGDVIALTAAAVVGQTGDSANAWGRGLYEVTSYDPATKVAGITPNIAGHNRAAADRIAVVTREIQFRQVGTAGINRVNNDNNSQTFRNVWFHGFSRGIGGNTHTVVSCAASRMYANSGGLLYVGTGSTVSGNVTATDCTLGGVCYYGVSHVLSGSFWCSNNTNGGVCCVGVSHVLSGSFWASNNANGGVCCYGTSHVLSGSFWCSNNTLGGVCFVGTSHVLSGSFWCSNNTLGGVCREVRAPWLSGSFVTVGNSAAGLLNTCGAFRVTGTVNCAEATAINISDGYLTRAPLGLSGVTMTAGQAPFAPIVWLNYDGAGRHRVFTGGMGSITTPATLDRITLDPTSATLALHLDIPVTAHKPVFRMFQKCKQTGAMAYRPRIQLLDPDADPLYGPTGSLALAEAILTGTVGDDETLMIRATGLTVGKRYAVRLLAMDAAGSVDFYGRNVKEQLDGFARDRRVEVADVLLTADEPQAAAVTLAAAKDWR